MCLGNLSGERGSESEGEAWPKKRRGADGRGLEGARADADVVSSICADRAITMKKKGLDSRGESGRKEEREEGRRGMKDAMNEGERGRRANPNCYKINSLPRAVL